MIASWRHSLLTNGAVLIMTSHIGELCVSRATYHQVSYKIRYTHPFAHAKVMIWDNVLSYAIANGTTNMSTVNDTKSKEPSQTVLQLKVTILGTYTTSIGVPLVT